MSQASFNSNLEWECKPYTQEDLYIAKKFRAGELEGDVYSLKKYQDEGMLAFLLLPKSALQIGLGWFRYIPTFLDPNKEKDDSRLTSNQFQLQDDMGLTLLNSVLIAARGSSQNFQHGQLIKFFAGKSLPSKPKVCLEAENRSFYDHSVPSSRKNLLSDSYGNSLGDASVVSDFAPHSIVDENEDLDISISSLNTTGNNSMTYSHVTPKSSRTLNSKRPYSALDSPGEERLNCTDRDVSWCTTEDRKVPTGVPMNFKTIFSDAYWIKNDPTIRSEKEQFSEIISEIFIAMRTPVNRPYSDIDLTLTVFDIGIKALQKLSCVYNTDPLLKSKASMLQSNQTSWVLGNARLSCPTNQQYQLKQKFTKSLKDSANLPGDLYEDSLLVVKMWGMVPISRMENLSFSFFEKLKCLGKNGASQISKAIEHLNNRYPSSV